MPLINFTKDQLSIIQTSLEASIKYADSEYISKVDNILEKIGNLDDLCECGGKTNWYIIQHKWGSFNVRWRNQNVYNYL